MFELTDSNTQEILLALEFTRSLILQ